jgi:hypothetical protein
MRSWVRMTVYVGLFLALIGSVWFRGTPWFQLPKWHRLLVALAALMLLAAMFTR